ncbi:aldehyde dehydrogenase family protein [Schlesneria sp. T3-172]|uniref:aldehyde dehydrogenase family protein n=1 Tax=Schlesneria sphaerica TaxID=3373610 RepID=UPI0037CB6969
MKQVVQAFDRSLICEVPVDDADALERKLVTAATLFADRAARLKPHQRLAILQRLEGLMDVQRDFLSRQIAREGGKPLTDAKVEVTRAIDGVRCAAVALRTSGGQEIPMGLTAASSDRRAFTIQEPIGVVAGISAFNHPLNLIVHQVVPAVAAGCPIIIKPASSTPLSCFSFVNLLHEAGLPPEWCQTFLPASSDLAEVLVSDRRVAFVSFIGSGKVGWRLRSILAPGTRIALEHGGSAPAIIDQAANLDHLIEPLVKGGYYHAGQVCVSTQRIYVHQDLKTEFLKRFTARVAALKVGDPLNEETEVGPMITPAEADRVTEWIDEAVAGGAELIGGGRLSHTTVVPSILVNPSVDSKVSTQEVFGPTTCVYSYADLDQAIEAANSLPFAFQASIFTEHLRTALYASERLDASTVMINDHTAFRTDWMPFGGRRESGYGIGGIPYTMRDLTQEKLIVFRSS